MTTSPPLSQSSPSQVRRTTSATRRVPEPANGFCATGPDRCRAASTSVAGTSSPLPRRTRAALPSAPPSSRSASSIAAAAIGAGMAHASRPPRGFADRASCPRPSRPSGSADVLQTPASTSTMTNGHGSITGGRRSSVVPRGDCHTEVTWFPTLPLGHRSVPGAALSACSVALAGTADPPVQSGNALGPVLPHENGRVSGVTITTKLGPSTRSGDAVRLSFPAVHRLQRPGAGALTAVDDAAERLESATHPRQARLLWDRVAPELGSGQSRPTSARSMLNTRPPADFSPLRRTPKESGNPLSPPSAVGIRLLPNTSGQRTSPTEGD